MRFFFLAAGLLAAWKLLSRLSWASGPGPGPSGPRRISMTAVDLVRNGAFSQDKTAWATNATGTHVGCDYGRDGPGLQIWPEFSDNYGYVFQELYLPSRVTAATLSLNYRFLPGLGATLGVFRARLVTLHETVATLFELTADPGEGWQDITVTLTSDQRAALDAARSAGERIHLILELHAQSLYVNLDHVAFSVSGEREKPALEGSIAYVGLNADGQAQTVSRLEADGSQGRVLWTHPGRFPATNIIGDVAWKPDGLELAFTSNHESACSAFHSDAFGIRPDGSGLRRITNPPSRADLDTGGYQLGTVTGRVYNNYGRVSTFRVYVEGALEAVPLDIGDYGDRTEFTVENVADLGLGLHYVVFHWSTSDCASGREYAAAVVDVDPGETADAGVLIFNGNCGEYLCQDLSWRRDGSQLGVHVVTPKKFLAVGEAIGADLFDAPLTANGFAWSPVDGRILYRRQTFDPATAGIYLTTDGGDAGIRLVPDDGAVWVGLAWLPDGSGFVYTLDSRLFYCDLSNTEITLLAEFYNEFVTNPSLSPDGNHIVFERQSTDIPPRHDLWIMNRRDPGEMWPLTGDGRSTNPNWSWIALGTPEGFSAHNDKGQRGGNP